MPIKNDKSVETDKLAETASVEGNPGGDRHNEKKPLETGSGEGVFSRRYYLVAGSYLAIVVLLLVFAILKWGKLPISVPGLPGAEGGLEHGFQKESTETDCQEDRAPVPENIGAGEETSAEMTATMGEEALIHGKPDILENDAQIAPEAGKEENAAEKFILKAASPLPQWELSNPFGCYVAEKLPSGGSLHRLTRGVCLKAAPGAPVAALWDGTVLKMGNEGAFYGNFILIGHEGGHQTFYGNLGEVWLEEGRSVSRGENIGLLPSFMATENSEEISSVEEPGIPVIKEHFEEKPASAVTEKAAFKKPAAGMVPIRNIWKGYLWEKVATPVETAADGPTGDALLVSTPKDRGNPLLYLEVRLGNNYIDPLEFIEARN